jgi:hypothetical protein
MTILSQPSSSATFPIPHGKNMEALLLTLGIWLFGGFGWLDQRLNDI